MSASTRPKSNRAGRRAEWLLSAPPMVWLALFFAVPTLLVLGLSFKAASPSGGLDAGWSLDAWRALANPLYPRILWRTLCLSAIATAVCIAIALPVAYVMGRTTPRRRAVLLLAFVVPFWTNLLIRVIAWKQLLHPAGWVKGTLASLGLVGDNATLLYNSGAVLLVMVYTYLPFAILPLYAAAEKFDFGLLDAARDLGAGPAAAFWQVFVPGVRRGLAVALLMVFVPGLGAYVIPELVGGPSGEMLGNKIAQRVFVDRNLPLGAVLASLLMLGTIALAVAARLIAGRNSAKLKTGKEGKS